MATIKTIIEFLKIVISTWKYINNEIDEATYNNSVKERKEFREKFKKVSRAERLRMLRDKAK